MNTTYEWDYETLDEHGDIIDHNHADKLFMYNESDKEDARLVLVRETGDEDGGLEDRVWAYVKDGKLPEYFSNGLGEEINTKVPQRFHSELSKYIK